MNAARNSGENDVLDAEVIIVGGGPTGMATALELRSRGVAFVLVEAGDGTVGHPKVSSIGPRSMEFFRRWGVADDIRHSGWPDDHPLDCVWTTRIGGHELFRLPRHTMGTRPDFRHTPEPDAICPQHWLGPLLRKALGVHPDGPVRMSTRLESFTQDGTGVTAVLSDGTEVRARYLIACDGASSPIRKHLGIAAPAVHDTLVFRNVLFHAPELRERLGDKVANFFYLMISSALRFPVRALDGRGLYRMTVGLQGSPESTQDAETLVRKAIAFDTPVEVLSDNEWHLVHRVAENFRSGRVFLVGDSAHTLSPSGGFGMNTGICGAADLGWKLTAELRGWAGPDLLDSYTLERQPVAFEGLEEANRNLERAMRREVPPFLNDDTPQGAAMRAKISEGLQRGGVAREFDAPEIHLGFTYAGSGLVIDDPTAENLEDRRPNTRPGSRAPHAWVKDGMSTLDLFGDGFVLAHFEDSARLAAFAEAFDSRGIPFRAERLDAPEIATAYERPFVLVRPDGHVAWRGTDLPADAGTIADTVRGGAR
ncbi:2-polyprenyl-6-methoxyphenol hydroxylase [Lentzea waywayandensis]|uniref:2-polyprenyl-6-methoxyphenol hydroxylase n=1 Tax=Lentzea waywayandensis TaxID=84724 RepID=A0A1I6DE40_9PSEU|nr:FAD-dependent monooxygenase [Lentzea waywayandensis]SFR03719.1 2-polyprenyl-6-methoxyphenol hydroxylase [Lentzea waywayandensis]